MSLFVHSHVIFTRVGLLRDAAATMLDKGYFQEDQDEEAVRVDVLLFKAVGETPNGQSTI